MKKKIQCLVNFLDDKNQTKPRHEQINIEYIIRIKTEKL